MNQEEELEEFDKLEEIYGIKEDLQKRRLFDNVTIEEFSLVENDEELKIEEDIQEEMEDDIQKDIEESIENSVDNENEKELDTI